MSNYKVIDMKDYPRRNHFDHFNSLAYPYVGVTVNVDITILYESIKKRNVPFFLTLCHLVATAANSIPELRQRIVNNELREYESCMTSHTVALDDGTYAYCNLDHSLEYDSYIQYGLKQQSDAKDNKSLKDDPSIKDELIFISSLPWLAFTTIVNPVPIPADSNPRITWGKYFEENDKVILPLSILCNHAIVDGIHLSYFYDELDRLIESFASKD